VRALYQPLNDINDKIIAVYWPQRKLWARQGRKASFFCMTFDVSVRRRSFSLTDAKMHTSIPTSWSGWHSNAVSWAGCGENTLNSERTRALLAMELTFRNEAKRSGTNIATNWQWNEIREGTSTILDTRRINRSQKIVRPRLYVLPKKWTKSNSTLLLLVRCISRNESQLIDSYIWVRRVENSRDQTTTTVVESAEKQHCQ